MPAFLHSPKPPKSSQNSSESRSAGASLAYSRTELTMLKLGFTRTDIIEMPYAKAAWYVQAATGGHEEDRVGVRDATQADIDSF